MALNPIVYTEKVVNSFLRYQLTRFPFSDDRLYEQMRRLLRLEETRDTPLLKGPYVSLSRSFREGAAVETLVREGVLHPFMRNLIPYETLYGHQEKGIRSVVDGRTTLISTGTGSGKTECFLYPIISRCLALRDEDAPAGITAVLIYPMNALAEDQMGRLRGLLAGTGIPFGMYVGSTPERSADVAGERLPEGASRADYERALEQAKREHRATAVHPGEERCSREEMRTPGRQPRILVTNVKQLELLLTRQADVELFDDARLEFLVTDEAHTFSGAGGAETACLLRRLRSFCGRDVGETTCVATSATLADPETGAEAGRQFAGRFFGVNPDNVELVTEQYAEETWADERRPVPAPSGEPAAHLQAVLQAVDQDDEPGGAVSAALRAMSGQQLEIGRWQEALYDHLAANETVYQIAKALDRPRALRELPAEMEPALGRAISEEEILAWLALGVAARKNERPLLRPVVHAFVRGLGGAVVTFPDDNDEPRLWLSAEDERRAEGDEERLRLPVLACTSCGQHYFQHHLEDFSMQGGKLGGGKAVGHRRYWPGLAESRGGARAVLTDRVVGAEDEEGGLGKLTSVYLCRHCGALHPDEVSRCDGCGEQSVLVTLYAIAQKEDRPGQLPQCVSCGAPGRPYGGRYREPARPVRAVSVADVHVLAQDMVHHAERKRLLVFADNRQDAAFQAGWMQDHARRFRLRSLMYERIREGAVKITDLVAWLDDCLERDRDLSRALIPEVWEVSADAESDQHRQERRYFLRIQVLRELTIGVKQPIGLEPWGRLRVDYAGLDASQSFIVDEAAALGVRADELVQGIGAFLDLMRRRNLALYDRDGEIFTRFWREGDAEVSRGYLPKLPGVPKGLKLCRAPGDEPNRVYQWAAQGGHLTNARQIAQSWGVPRDDVDAFLERLWRFLAEDLRLLVPVTLKGSRGRALPACNGVYQIDSDKLRLTPLRESYRCNKCRRTQVRSTPHNRCMGWHCDGTLTFRKDDPDSYDLALLDQRVDMIRPKEHSAQVPAEERDRIERLFKGTGQAINALVCTPTLELGVDIGELDTVLLRNVPPLPANYWQRVGRAGRRHRMAVNLTYARPVSHDLVYFSEPLKMLEGRVEPPRFNLRNPLMVRKHVHATLLTRLHQLAREDSGLGEHDREEIREALAECFPSRIRSYLFNEDGDLKAAPTRADRLRTVLSKHENDLVETVSASFARTWPKADAAVVGADMLTGYVQQAGDALDEVIGRLRQRLDWALNQMERLDERRKQQGVLEPADDALFQRCKRLVRRIKGVDYRQRQQAEGFDDTVTYSVLAAEGYLPGYGLEIGSILGTAQMPPLTRGAREYPLRRPPAMALREFVPGNLIYANGQRFTPRYFHRAPGEPVRFRVDPASSAVIEAGTDGAATALGSTTLRAIPVCDVDMSHFSHISDDEEFRFQMPVSVFGYEQQRWSGGAAYRWGSRDLMHRRGVHLRLVNVGSTRRLEADSEQLGYPVCLVCGQSRSPFASQRELDHFREDHEQRCNRTVEATGFYADVVADCLTLPDCKNQTEAYSLLEALRTAAANVLEMETEDLDILVIGRPGSEQVDGVLYDPMPGGSGLLEQIIDRFPEVWAAAENLVENCPSACGRACVDCLLRFRNAFFHAHLDRHLALERLQAWGDCVDFDHDIPSKQPQAAPGRDEVPVNVAEQALQAMLRAAGFPEPKWQMQISLGRPLGTTTPDCYFPEDDPKEPGICIYLDGLSRGIHGNPEVEAKDRAIREQLRAQGYEVFEIAASDLSDPEKMSNIFFRLGRLLLGRSEARRLRDERGWFQPPSAIGDRSEGTPKPKDDRSQAGDVLPFEIVEVEQQEPYKSAIPLLSLRAAAGGFGESMEVEPEAWVRPNTSKRLDRGMFVVQVVGKSMEPKIPDGAYCIFRAPVTGSRTGKILLVQHRDIHDPETGGSYTVKRFDSTGVAGKEGAIRKGRIRLSPLNPDYQPIELQDTNDDEILVVAELIEILPGNPETA